MVREVAAAIMAAAAATGQAVAADLIMAGSGPAVLPIHRVITQRAQAR
jgi:hypothetical protein